MSCPRNHLIVRLVGGELADAEERGVRQHLAACPTCAQAFEELRATWDGLGEWNVDSAHIDLTGRVLARVTEQENPDHRSLLIAVFRGGHLRVAASIALAVGLGVATGVLAPKVQTFQGSQSSSIPTAVELAEALGLDELATRSATGLPLEFEPEATEGTEVEP